jgi:succinyldiaminopimelate transaminase
LPRPNPVLDRLPEYPTARLEAKRREVRATGRRLFDFGVGDPVEPVPDFIREALVAGVPEDSGYPAAGPAMALCEAAAGYLRRRFDVRLDPGAEILPTSGGKEATFQIPFLVADPGGERVAVAFPDPGYPGYVRGVLFAGAEPVAVPLGSDFRMRLWELPKDVLRRVRMVWINNPHNPSGAVMTEADLRRTWETCREIDALLVADECYVDVWDDVRPPSLLQAAREGVLVLHSLSKRSGLTGYRTGFVAGDPRWVAALRDLRAHVGLTPQDFVNSAAAAAWRDDGHAEDRRQRLARRKRRFVGFLKSKGYEIVASEATFYVWARPPGGRSGLEEAERLLRNGIVAAPGDWFSLGSAGSGYVRFAVCPGDEELEEAIAAWEGA